MVRDDLLTTNDPQRWRAALPADACVMGSVEYARILEAHAGHAARLLVVEAAGSRIAYPFLLRPIQALPFAAAAGKGRFDTMTPEYTGPLWVRHDDSAGDAARAAFTEIVETTWRELAVVAEFAHLNPWQANDPLLDANCVEVDREIVFVDLALGDDLWMKALSSDARRQTRQAQKAGVHVRRATSRDDVLEFHRVYTSTMQRRVAHGRYYFAPEYFLAFFETLPERSFFALAEYQGRVVAGGLYLHDAHDIYWHLSAVDMEFSAVRPVNAYHYDTIQWAARAGKKRMLCGGGHEPGDGVFRFKAGFSPLRARFKVYKRVRDRDAYEALVRAWCAHHGAPPPRAGFFPAYRCAHPLDVPQPAAAAVCANAA